MGASAIMQVQLKAFQQALDLAIATRQASLIVIHGIGKGVLKNEISGILNQTNGIQRYVNEYDIRYGYGATKVFFRY
jgi:dsDNA-specific endonuclease/ATPase MutS2